VVGVITAPLHFLPSSNHQIHPSSNQSLHHHLPPEVGVINAPLFFRSSPNHQIYPSPNQFPMHHNAREGWQRKSFLLRALTLQKNWSERPDPASQWGHAHLAHAEMNAMDAATILL